MKRRKFGFVCFSPVVIGLLMLTGCASLSSIDRYTEVQIKPDNDHVFILTPAPKNVQAYDPTIADHWERTFNHCAQIKNAISIELGQRESRVSSRRAVLLSCGGIAGLINSIYTGIKEDPEKKVTIPLSILSGTALLSFLPGLSDDDQIPLLRSKLEKLSALQSKAEIALVNVNKGCTEKAFLDLEEEKEQDASKLKILRDKIKDVVMRLDDLTATLNQALLDWANEAR